MFAKVNVPLLGVVENMSGLALNGTINDSEGGPISSGSVDLYGENVAINEEGQFDFVLDLFKRGGGKKESERLDVPLLGEIPMTPDIMASTDLGEPIIRKEPNSSSAKAFQSVVENLLSSLK